MPVKIASERITDSGHRVGYLGFKDQMEYTKILMSAVQAINNDPSLSAKEKYYAVRRLTVKSAARMLNKFAKQIGLLASDRTPLAEALDDLLSPGKKSKHKKSGLK